MKMMKKHHGYFSHSFFAAMKSNQEPWESNIQSRSQHTHTQLYTQRQSNGYIYENCMNIKMGFHFITPKRNNLGLFCSEMLLVYCCSCCRCYVFFFSRLLLFCVSFAHSVTLSLPLRLYYSTSIWVWCVVVAVCVSWFCPLLSLLYVFKPAVDIIQVYSDKSSQSTMDFTRAHQMWYFSI